MGKIASQFAAIWNKLGINQKATIVILMVGLLAGIAALVHLSRRPSYEMLYSDLDEKDMGQVVSYLKDAKVPYTITGGGKTILVPEGTRYELRVGMVDKGIVTNGKVGLELWQSPGFGASPLAEQMMKRRAMQGELARTIMHIDPVAWADVQVAQPEQALFKEDQRPVTAAISLKLKPSRTLTSSQVAGICRLVAGSIEGLEPKNVTVIDEQGNLLTAPRSDVSSAEAADAHNYRRAFEEHLAAKAQAMLDKALGAGRSVVKVSATLDMDQISETREILDPATRVARTEKTMSKNTAGSPAEGSQAGSHSEELNETNYEVPKSVRTTHTAPGNIKRLDVAVIADPTFLDKDGKEQTLSQQQRDDLSLLVKRAVGLDDARKDTLQTSFMPFARRGDVSVTPASEQPQDKPYVLQVVKYASSALAVIVFVVFASLTLRRMSRTAPVAAGVPGAPAPAYFDTEILSLGGNGQGHLKNRVKDLMARDPATAARLLQHWISEEEKKGK